MQVKQTRGKKGKTKSRPISMKIRQQVALISKEKTKRRIPFIISPTPQTLQHKSKQTEKTRGKLLKGMFPLFL